MPNHFPARLTSFAFLAFLFWLSSKLSVPVRFAQESADPNTRDYTGRTPLHLAIISLTLEIVCHPVDARARLVAHLSKQFSFWRLTPYSDGQQPQQQRCSCP